MSANEISFETLALAKRYTDEQVQSGIGVVVDNALSENSINPVQNKVITKAINTIDNKTNTDISLTESGKPADAKIVGDKFNQLPTKFPNPNELIFTGAIQATYDGSSPVTVNVPLIEGQEGFSPIAKVDQSDEGATITITDKEGTTIATIKNGSVGKTGISGIDGREVELRKGNTAIEWRYSTNIAAKAQFNSAGARIPVTENDIITKLNLIGCPSKVKFAQIKLVTIFGADENGKDVANANCSFSSPVDKFEFLRGFDPTIGPIDISSNASIEGNMSIEEVKIAGLKLLQVSTIPVTYIKKIRLWVYFLDANKNNIGDSILVDFNIGINSSETNNWKPIITFEDIQKNLDYNQLLNIPIKNIIGTKESPIIFNSLKFGNYKITGLYKYNNQDVIKNCNDSLLLSVFQDKTTGMKMIKFEEFDNSQFYMILICFEDNESYSENKILLSQVPTESISEDDILQLF